MRATAAASTARRRSATDAGLALMMLGGILLAATFVAEVPGGVALAGWLAFAIGLLLVLLGAGLRTAIGAVLRLFP